MHKNILTVVGITILFLGTCITPTVAIDNVKKSTFPIGSGNTLYVGGSGEGNYTTIQDAIDDASNGDTVFVFDDSSPYKLSNYLNIEKSINLIGENRDTTVISGLIDFNDGSSNTDVLIFITTDWVNISGFTIQDSEHSGITVYMGNNINISGNIFIDHEYVSMGFVVSNHSYISDNIFTSNKADGPFREGGLILDFVSFTSVIGNVFTNCFVGITLECYYMDAPYDLKGNIISNNLFDNNNVAMEIQANCTLITRNTISNHTTGWSLIMPALRLTGCNNTITCNNFINNLRDANNVQYIYPSQDMSKIRKNRNVWDGNYWGRPRLLPKIIIGYLQYYRGPPERDKIFPFINIDWHPAKEPYDI